MLSAFIPALALTVSLTQPDPTESEVSIEELAQGWASGDAERASTIFHEAFKEVSEGACALSPYAAGLAYRIGLLEGSGYHFNVAIHIDGQVGGLTPRQRVLAQGFKTEPGDLVSEDRLFVFSPYGDSDHELGACPDLGFPQLPEPAAGRGDYALVYVRAFWRGAMARRQLSEIDFLDAYPPVEGPDLAQQLIGYRTFQEERGWEMSYFTFDPCMQQFSPQQPFEVCREGFQGSMAEAD